MRLEMLWAGGTAGRAAREGRRRALLAALAACSLVVALAAPTAARAQSTAVVAWGDNYRFDLGAGYRDTAGDAIPVPVLGISNVTSLLAAGSTSYALLPDETLRAWGGGVKGQLGDGVTRTGDETLPGGSARSAVTVLEQNSAGERHELMHVKQIAASYGSITHALALVENAQHETEVLTWGASEYGERGNGEYGFVTEEAGRHAFAPREVAVASTGLKHAVYVAAGGASSFAITEEDGKATAWAWGSDRYGALGVGNVKTQQCRGEGQVQPCITRPTPIALPPLTEGAKVTAIYGGRGTTYARLSNGQVLAWGANDHGQLGNGVASTESNVPVYVCAVGASVPCGPGSHLGGIKELAGGSLSALALTQAGTVVGWGSNGDGELGGTSSEVCLKGFTACQKVPKVVGGLEHIATISEGPSVTLALTESGTVYSLGLNDHGQLGSGSLVGPEECAGEEPCSRTPVPVAGLSAVGGISAGVSEPGEGHALAWLESGSGPAPLLTVTPGHKTLTLTWTFSDEEFKVAYLPAPEFSKSQGKWVTVESGRRTCSVSKPCTTTITGLGAEQYEVKLDSLHKEGKKIKVDDAHVVFGTPEP